MGFQDRSGLAIPRCTHSPGPPVTSLDPSESDQLSEHQMANNSFGRRQFLLSGAALAGAAVLGASAPGRLLAAQQQTLTLYNGQHKKTTAAVVRAFTRATGIQVNVRNGHSSQLA